MTLDLIELEGRTEILWPQSLETETIPTGGMSEVTKLLAAVARGVSEAGGQWFPLVNEKWCRFATARMFGGLKIVEVTAVPNVSQATIKRRRSYVKPWLRREFESGDKKDKKC